MRYYTDGHHVVRVRTDADRGDPEFRNATGETFNAIFGWRPSTTITNRILYTGDWDTCSEAEASAVIGTDPITGADPLRDG